MQRDFEKVRERNMANMCKIVFICRDSVERRVPLINITIALSRMGWRVVVVASSCRVETKDHLAAEGVDVISLNVQTASQRSYLGRISTWFNFRLAAWNYLKTCERDCLWWICSADTALTLGRKLLEYRYVLQLNELYDDVAHYRIALKKYALGACRVVVPEANRAAIYKTWYGLKRKPDVIPNRPVEVPTVDLRLETVRGGQEALAAIGSQRSMLLYQGQVTIERDLRTIARVMTQSSKEWQFVIMGTDHGHMDDLHRENRKIVHIPFIPAPFHLAITRRARIGVVSYEYTSLNQLFCAPNKIWEYAAYGVPMLCNDVPGLEATVGRSGAGICVNFDSEGCIENGIAAIEKDYEAYSCRARQMFASVDLSSIVRGVIEGAVNG